jgi:hypothetical protein
MITASSRLGNLVLTCSVCKTEKHYNGMVAQIVIERFAKAMEREHDKCKKKIEKK